LGPAEISNLTHIAIIFAILLSELLFQPLCSVTEICSVRNLISPFLFVLCIMWLATTLFSSCYEEKFTTDPGDTLTFSTDTLQFDTVLTAISTVTRYFKVYNPHDLFIRISEVRLTGEYAGFFRLNVDGTTGDIIRDIQINPKDSIYVFAEATIDPDQPVSISPFFIESDVSFTVNNQEQKVKLVAWGQNANYIPGPDVNNKVLVLSCDLGQVTWDDPKPYVLYGTLLIDSCALILPPGTRLYVHGGIANNELGIYNQGLIYTLPQGRILVEGTKDQPVIIRDDRIEPDYGGAWAGIRLGPESGPHSFSHLQLSNALVGIAADSASEVDIDHSILAYTDGAGFFARHAMARISNSLFYENGGQGIALTYGGDYTIDFCTMANYGNTAEALLMNDFYCSDPLCSDGARLNKLTIRVNNSIMVGSSSDEIWIADAGSPADGWLDILMHNNLVLVDDLVKSDQYPQFFSTLCLDCFEYMPGDKLFKELQMDNYHLDSLSIAEQKAIPVPGITDDLDGNIRDGLLPDIGCYEYRY
jgi:hypothetical protein